jgi:hypothetical protein
MIRLIRNVFFWAIAGLTLVVACGDAPAPRPETIGKATQDLVPGINNAPTINTFVVYATQNVTLGTGGHYLGGDIGVATTTSASVQLTVGSQDQLDALHNLYSPSVLLDGGAVVGDIETNSLTNGGGVYNTLAAYPSTMPPLPQLFSASPSSNNVTVAQGQSQTLTPGSYGALTDNGILNLQPGSYSFSSVTLGNNAQLQAQQGGSTSLLVAGTLSTGTFAQIFAAGQANALTISVGGSDGPGGSPPAVSLGANTQITALLAAANGSLSFGNNVQATGAFAGQNFTAGNNVQLNFQSGFPIQTPSLSTFVAYAELTLTLGSAVQSQGGDIGVGAVGGSSVGTQLTVGSQDLLDQQHVLYAPSISLGSNSVVGDIEATTLQNNGGHFGADLPYPAAMPLLPLVPISTPNGSNVSVALGQIQTLTPGSYGTLTDNGILNLKPGTYSFSSVTLGNNAQIVAQSGGATVLQVSGSFAAGQGAQIFPNAQQAGALTISVGGNDGAAPAASIGALCNITALLEVPLGTISIGNGAQITGAMAAFNITAGSNVSLNFQSGLPNTVPPAGTQPITSYTLPPAAPLVGPVPGNTMIFLAIGLPLQNAAGLQAIADAVSNPTNPAYQQYISPSTFMANYAPSSTTYGQLASWAQSYGFTTVSYPNYVLLDVTGTAAEVEQALNLNLNYANRSDGSVFYVPDRQPRSTLTFTLLGVSGLDSYVLPTPAVTPTATCTNPFLGYSATPLFQSSDLRAAYLGGSGSACANLQGSGQSIGLFEFDGFTATDITLYESNTNLTGVPAVKVQRTNDPKGRSPGCPNCPSGPLAPPLAPSAEQGTVECSGDIEFAIAMAPQAQVIAFEGTTQDSILEDIACNPAVSQISSSWFFGPSGNTQTLLTIMAAQGQSFFEALGDFGAFEPPSMFAACPAADTSPSPGNGPATTIQAPFPDVRALKYVTLVGGTELTASGETTWPSGAGGIFTKVSAPTYQSTTFTTDSVVSTTNRDAPDVSAVAQGLFSITSDCGDNYTSWAGSTISSCPAPQSCTQTSKNPPLYTLNACPAASVTPSQCLSFQGTSASAPVWAGFTALINSQSTTGPIGFINPAIYQIGANATRYRNSFNDIQDMSTNPNSCGFSYSAVRGYDLATGWGTPKCSLVTEMTARPSVQVGVSGTLQGPMICLNGSGFTPGGTVTVQYAGVPEEPIVPNSNPPVPTLDTLTSTKAVTSSGTFQLTDLSETHFVGSAVSAGVSACTPAEIAKGTVSVNVTDNTLGLTATAAMPASYWCQTSQLTDFGGGCHPASVSAGVSGTPQGPMICLSGSGFTSGDTVTVQYAGVPEQPLVASTNMPQLETITSTPPVTTSGTFQFTDLSQIDLVGSGVSAGVSACTSSEISNGSVSVDVTDNTTGAFATTTVPASFWCETNQSVTFGAGCQPAPVATVTLSNVSFGTTGGNGGNCGNPAQPANNNTINGENSNGDLVYTCSPTPNSDGTFSTNPTTPNMYEVSCGNGHGALIAVSCSGNGTADTVVNASVTFSIEGSCGSYQIDGNDQNIASFPDVVPGAPQSSSVASCAVAFGSLGSFNLCATGNACGFNDFSANATVFNLSP